MVDFPYTYMYIYNHQPDTQISRYIILDTYIVYIYKDLWFFNPIVIDTLQLVI